MPIDSQRIVSVSVSVLVPLAVLATTVVACSSDATPDETSSEENLAGRARVPSGPVLLVHAFHATPENAWSMEPVATELRKSGAKVYLARVSPYAGTPARAAELGKEIDRVLDEHCEKPVGETRSSCLAHTRVHLVGHSQGGLDARYVVGKLGYAAKVASVTTLGAPHEGTPLGDAALRLLGDPRVRPETPEPDASFAREMTSFVSSLGGERLASIADAFYWLSEARAKNPRDRIPDVPSVHYESWAGVATSDGSLPSLAACEGRATFPMRRAGELSGLADFVRFESVRSVFDASHSTNDGHIPVASARYPVGSEARWDFRGCVPADHLDLIGRPEGQQVSNGARTGVPWTHPLAGLVSRLRETE